jgi:exosortase/archaeosortase family protein
MPDVSGSCASVERTSSIVARLVAFLGAFTLQQLAWQALRGSLVEWVVIHWGTVWPAALLINLMTPDAQARAVGFSLAAPGGGLNILNGCEGMEALFLLSAAFLVAPASWASRAKGLLLGAPVVFLVNQARILALFYAYRADASIFDPLHGTVTPIVVILIVTAYFYAWLLHARRVTVAA